MGFYADRLERALDDALFMTFPASDPIAVSMRGPDVMLAPHDPRAVRVSPLPCVAPSSPQRLAIERRRRLKRSE